MSTTDDDPEDTPWIRHVLYTNDVRRIVASFVSGLLTVAEPERVRVALQDLLDNWKVHIDQHEQMKRLAEQVEERAKAASQAGN
jgi:hypothetical protein